MTNWDICNKTVICMSRAAASVYVFFDEIVSLTVAFPF